MIFIFSDFGLTGPYSGTMRSVVMRNAPDVPVCDLMVDAPDRNPKASAYLLAALQREFSNGDVVLAVVDPGVGSTRKGIVVRADGVTYVGPDNGLFEMIIRRAAKVDLFEIDWHPALPSASFHGRDIFAPVAARLAADDPLPMVALDLSARCQVAQIWPDTLAEVIYVDTYGNVMTGLPAQGKNAEIRIGGHSVKWARTFSDVAQGQGVHYENSIGLCELAVNCGRADILFNAVIGMAVTVDTA
ncbi:SAM-dependent chlorinase/fluorinase [Thalassospira sp. MA62]|nr:SAM-dependent chlorinase/fluorinase [Thalassospira sp. MA62]